MGNMPFNLFFSFRVRMVFFVMLVLFVTILALYFINRHSEQRITQLVADHIRDTSLAVDLAQSSFPSGRYLYQLIPLRDLSFKCIIITPKEVFPVPSACETTYLRLKSSVSDKELNRYYVLISCWSFLGLRYALS